MEIDYEKSSNPDKVDLQKFVAAYRSVIPYEPDGRELWLKTSGPVLDYGNAMVASQNTTIGTLETGWQQHVQGTSSVPVLAPAKLTGSLWVVANGPIPNCVGPFSSSGPGNGFNFVSTIPPSEGTSSGMLGYMFWGGGCQGNGTVCTYPPDTCQIGVGTGATTFNIPVPMAALRQQ